MKILTFTRQSLKHLRCSLIFLFVTFFTTTGWATSADSLFYENFEDNLMDSRIKISTIGSFNSYPAIKNTINLGGTKAFGFGLSSCPASCFDNYVTKFIITLPKATYISTISFKEMELFGNWGSWGEIYLDDVPTGKTFGRLPFNDRQPDTNYRQWNFSIEQNVSTIAFRITDITSSSEIFMDDLLLLSTSISPLSQSFEASGGTGIINVTADPSFTWTATSNASWIKITSGSSGVGKGTVTYSVDVNNNATLRIGTMTISGHTFTVEQAGTATIKVYVLSGGNSSADQTVHNALIARGILPTLGVQPHEWKGTQANLKDFKAVVLLNNYNYTGGSMPQAGQTALINYVAMGGGLVTGEWLLWNIASSRYTGLDPMIPATYTRYNVASTTTYSVIAPDPVLNNGLPARFAFLLNGITGGSESFLKSKTGATEFYHSSNSDMTGIVGWKYQSGRVISFSTLLSHIELADANYARLFANAIEWVANAGKTLGIPISPVATTPQFANQEFWVDIKVGDAANPVTNLFGVSFCLTFTNTDFIDVVPPCATNVVAGDFIGNDAVFQCNIDEAAGKVCIGITRKAGQGGVNGNGTIARIKFKARPEIPDQTQVEFCAAEVLANDPSSNPISLTPGCVKITIPKCVIVWPGDTNNDGKVDQADVLPIGLHWGRTGQGCASPPSCAWSARCCAPWSTLAATNADANGDGVVNQADVLCLGLNWNKTHSTNFLTAYNGQIQKFGSAASASLAPDVKPVQAPAQEFFVRVKASEVANLFGLSFELLYDQSNFLQILAVEPDSLFGNDVVFYSNVDAVAGKIAVGISRKAGQSGVTGTGPTVRVKAIISNSIPNNTMIRFSLQNVFANDMNGTSIPLSLQSASTTVITTGIVVKDAQSPPDDYRLEQNYPNPFNPSTTIKFSLLKNGHATLKIFDLVGREIATLVDGELAAGRYEARWDANGVESGVYFYQLRAGEFSETKRLVLMR